MPELPRQSNRSLTPAQQLRKLQLAVNHIADVIHVAPSDCVAELSEAVDLIHRAETGIEEERDA
jgi:hypothetical protein